MSQPLKTKAQEVWQMVSTPETATTYKAAAALTWKIIRETGQLLWLVLCLVLVAGDWAVSAGRQANTKFQGWMKAMENKGSATPNGVSSPASEPVSMDEMLANTSKKFLEAAKTATTKAIATARAQLALEAKPVAEAPKPAVPTAPKPAPAPTVEAKPAATVAPMGDE